MSDVELPMRFESEHCVPKLFKFLHVQNHSLQVVYKRKTTRQTWLECNMASATEAVRKKGMQLQGAHHDLRVDFHMVLYILKFTCFRVTFK